MALKGTGMLLTMMDVAPEYTADFNEWYDTEHMEERASVPGFLDSRRYEAVNGEPEYFNTYECESLGTLSSPAYKEKIANQTAWSKTNLARFQNMHRTVGVITVTMGLAQGGYVGYVRLEPDAGREEDLRTWLAGERLPQVIARTDVLAAHLLEADAVLSAPLPEFVKPGETMPEPRDRFIIVEGATAEAVQAACDGPLAGSATLARGADSE